MKTLFKFFALIFLLSIPFACKKVNLNEKITNEISNDSTDKILFLSRRIDNSADWKMYVMNKDGSEQNEIKDFTVCCEQPVISNNNKKVSFVHNTEKWVYELYIVNTDGTGLNLIDSGKSYCGAPRWSQDDSKIVYIKNLNDTICGIFLYDLINKSITQLTDSNVCGIPSFSPDGKTITYYENGNICLMKLDGSNKKILLRHAGSYKWSPKGDKIAYLSTGEINSSQIFVAMSDGTNTKQLTNSYVPSWDSGFPPFGNYNPQWTPDESKIVYVSEAAHKCGNPEIFIMNSDGTNQIELTNSNFRSEDPAISLDGKYIIFSSGMDYLNYNADIFIMGINGDNQRPLSKYSGDDILPVIIKQ